MPGSRRFGLHHARRFFRFLLRLGRQDDRRLFDDLGRRLAIRPGKWRGALAMIVARWLGLLVSLLVPLFMHRSGRRRHPARGFVPGARNRRRGLRRALGPGFHGVFHLRRARGIQQSARAYQNQQQSERISTARRIIPPLGLLFSRFSTLRQGVFLSASPGKPGSLRVTSIIGDFVAPPHPAECIGGMRRRSSFPLCRVSGSQDTGSYPPRISTSWSACHPARYRECAGSG